ncbi:MAG: exlusion protein FxsA, partial [Proteobacteria bacterium SW_6_67_9]
GGVLLRYQGLQTMFRAQANLSRGQVPAIEMFEGVALAIGGALLLTPGLVTDVLGFLCLIPWSRRMMIHAAMRRMQVVYGPASGRGGSRPGGPSPHEPLEGDFEHRDRD